MFFDFWFSSFLPNLVHPDRRNKHLLARRTAAAMENREADQENNPLTAIFPLSPSTGVALEPSAGNPIFFLSPDSIRVCSKQDQFSHCSEWHTLIFSSI